MGGGREGAVDGWNRQNGLSTVLQIQLCHNIILLSRHIIRDLRRLGESGARKDYVWSKSITILTSDSSNNIYIWRSMNWKSKQYLMYVVNNYN